MRGTAQEFLRVELVNNPYKLLHIAILPIIHSIVDLQVSLSDIPAVGPDFTHREISERLT